VMDHITSYLRGAYYLITDSDGWDAEVNEDEMRDMLDKPVQHTSLLDLLPPPSRWKGKGLGGDFSLFSLWPLCHLSPAIPHSAALPSLPSLLSRIGQ
jgi:hypothetical protein